MNDDRIGVVSTLSFLCELALLGLLALAGTRLGGSTATEIVAAVGLPLAAAAVWSVWMAPTSDRRLADPGRLIAQIVLFDASGALLAATGLWPLGLAFALVASAIFAATRRLP